MESRFITDESSITIINEIKRSIFIEATQWTDGVGSTYFSGRIYVDGKWIATMPFQYGYGEHYKTIALDILQDAGYISQEYRTMWQASEAMEFDFYSTIRWTTKKEMIK